VTSDGSRFAFLGIVSFWSGYGSLLPVFPLLIAAPQYIAGVMSLGALMQAAQAFQRLTSALSWPVDNVAGIAICRASAERVLSLYEDVQALDHETRAPQRPHIERIVSPSQCLEINDLVIADPAGHVLLEHFNAQIRAGERVLVSGDSAVTASFFKAIAGLWPWGSGRNSFPEGGARFMPQRPYLPEGTLRQSLCYPRPPDAFSDQTIGHALECAGVGWLCLGSISTTIGSRCCQCAHNSASGSRAR
jgi:putative ATP-binding cassette transporter